MPDNTTQPIAAAEAINRLIKYSVADTNSISDGYHTFFELYEHRITLFVSMLRQRTFLLPDHVNSEIWRSLAHSDGSVWDGWFILGIFKEAGRQITYHLPISKWDETGFAQTLEKAPEWDGHNSGDVLVRLRKMPTYR